MDKLQHLINYLEEQKIDFIETFPNDIRTVEIKEVLTQEQSDTIALCVQQNEIVKKTTYQ